MTHVQLVDLVIPPSDRLAELIHHHYEFLLACFNLFNPGSQVSQGGPDDQKMT